MKSFSIPIPDAHLDLFFAPIRSKKDVIKLLMNTVKYVHSNVKITGEVKNFLKIIVDDMNRFIYESEDKIFSIRSPFHIKNEQGRLLFYTNNIADIDNVISSRILTFLNDERFESPNSLEFLEPLEELFEDPDRIWAFVHELMLFEDGYLRYDHDIENEDGRLHPISHLDVCYTTASTFKVGTYHQPCINYFVQLLDNKHEAKYLEKI
ncbi:hypothetical protein [Photobacterium sanguinicancri]|uniref:Uncharacterized protein n=1 Tax=Photobacterium sanguinicancri TaxID=875932 RepID=A0ABX4FRX9_9GAMM|nr:hypothetical protein [Photobacterium sanguinicancri]OZS41385.1 hypothetical protein ASV53_24025 [Photobacterium sanguinicancri]